jgi:hypothetical protein
MILIRIFCNSQFKENTFSRKAMEREIISSQLMLKLSRKGIKKKSPLNITLVHWTVDGTNAKYRTAQTNASHQLVTFSFHGMEESDLISSLHR